MDTSTILGYVLFAASEIFALLPTKSSGFLQTLVLGFGRSFAMPEKDVELAKSVVSTDKSFTTTVNMLSTNPQLKTIVDNLIANPKLMSIYSDINNNLDLINAIHNNITLHNVVNHIKDDQALCMSINTILTKNKNVLSIVETNLGIIERLNAQLANNLIQLMNSPHLSSTLNNMVSLNETDFNNVLTILDTINSNPSAISDILSVL
jgi:predicted regulator of amino acid metabolism with ACT domain